MLLPVAVAFSKGKSPPSICQACLPMLNAQLIQNTSSTRPTQIHCFRFSLFSFLLHLTWIFCSIMEKAKVIGPNGLAPISLQRQADVRITTEVIYDVITNSNMISLEESAHAPAAVRSKARADRLAGVQTVSAHLNGRRFTQVDVNNEPRKVCDASKDIEKAMKLAEVCHTLLPYPLPIHITIHILTSSTCTCAPIFDLSLFSALVSFFFFHGPRRSASLSRLTLIILRYSCLTLVLHRTSKLLLLVSLLRGPPLPQRMLASIRVPSRLYLLDLRIKTRVHL